VSACNPVGLPDREQHPSVFSLETSGGRFHHLGPVKVAKQDVHRSGLLGLYLLHQRRRHCRLTGKEFPPESPSSEMIVAPVMVNRVMEFESRNKRFMKRLARAYDAKGPMVSSTPYDTGRPNELPTLSSPSPLRQSTVPMESIPEVNTPRPSGDARRVGVVSAP
jgi:hypothetical protein